MAELVSTVLGISVSDESVLCVCRCWYCIFDYSCYGPKTKLDPDGTSTAAFTTKANQVN